MITIDNKTYRNIQEQVQKNKEDIAAFKSAEVVIADFGITVLGHVDTVEEIPASSYTYGNAYLVGTETPYDIYIYTRTDVEGEGEFINLGPLAVEGPKGDQGEQGPEGPQGQRGSQIYAGTDSPASTGAAQEGDIYIRTGSTSNAGQLFRYEDNDWKYKGSVRGPQGPQGPQGLMGPRGYTGDVGPKGDKGDPGQSFVIVGTLSNPSLLPDPETTPRNNAYVVKTASYNRLYFIAGENTLAWDYVEMGSVGTTITEDSGTHEIAVLDIQDLIPDGMQIIGTDVVEDNDYGLIVTGNIEAGVRSEMKSTENAGAYTIPIKNSDTIKIDVANSKFTLNLDADLTSKIGKALVHPNSAPTKTKLVGVDTSNAQTLIDADTYLPKTFNAEQTLKNTGGTTPLRLESNSGDCWLRFWGSNGQVGELGGNGTDKMPLWWDTTKSYKICLDQSEFTNRNAQNSMKLGSMIINFGNIGSYSSGSGLATYNVTFKTPFSNTNYWIMAVPEGDTSDSPQSYDYTGMVKVSNRSNTGCTFSVNYVAGNKRGVTYIAIGK